MCYEMIVVCNAKKEFTNRHCWTELEDFANFCQLLPTAAQLLPTSANFRQKPKKKISENFNMQYLQQFWGCGKKKNSDVVHNVRAFECTQRDVNEQHFFFGNKPGFFDL